MKRFSIVLLISLLVILLCVTSFSIAAEKKPIVITVAHVSPPTVPYTFGAEKFGEYLSLLLDREVTVEIYSGGGLAADEGEALEMLQDNLLDVSWSSTGNLAGFVPEIQFTDLPYLFEDIDHLDRVLSGEVGRAILDLVEEKTGVKALAYHEDAWRVITSKKKIETFEDMKGLKIRAMMAPIFVDMYKAMGADPTPIPWSELYTSLELGVVDAQDNGLVHSEPAGFFEVQDYVAMLHHYWSAGVVLMSQELWNKFTEEEKPLVRKAAILAGEIQRRLAWERERAQIKDIEAKYGVTFTYPKREPFEESVKDMNKKWFEKYPVFEEWYQKVQTLK